MIRKINIKIFSTSLSLLCAFSTYSQSFEFVNPYDQSFAEQGAFKALSPQEQKDLLLKNFHSEAEKAAKLEYLKLNNFLVFRVYRDEKALETPLKVFSIFPLLFYVGVSLKFKEFDKVLGVLCGLVSLVFLGGSHAVHERTQEFLNFTPVPPLTPLRPLEERYILIRSSLTPGARGYADRVFFWGLRTFYTNPKTLTNTAEERDLIENKKKAVLLELERFLHCLTYPQGRKILDWIDKVTAQGTGVLQGVSLTRSCNTLLEAFGHKAALLKIDLNQEHFHQMSLPQNVWEPLNESLKPLVQKINNPYKPLYLSGPEEERTKIITQLGQYLNLPIQVVSLKGKDLKILMGESILDTKPEVGELFKTFLESKGKPFILYLDHLDQASLPQEFLEKLLKYKSFNHAYYGGTTLGFSNGIIVVGGNAPLKDPKIQQEIISVDLAS